MKKMQPAFKKASSGREEKLNLLLLSTGYTGFADKVSELYGASPEKPKTILYVAYAVKDEARAAERWAQALAPFGVKLIAAHAVKDPVKMLDKVDGVFVSGGNTFRLADRL
ncbi:MAG: Type 1 glutamine amidotransferase-like domain-containing protein, partial [Alphaproteobacteria bacterium]|nr:Type 1 glutamine amidotransferase-like domain-containing protein [Alphaproteobacteria bacterium]